MSNGFKQISTKKQKTDDNTTESLSYTQMIPQEFIMKIKKEVLAILEMLSVVNSYIQLRLPSYSDSNSFESSVQSEILSELKHHRNTAAHILEDLSDYFSTHDEIYKLVTSQLFDPAYFVQVSKENHIKDYTEALKQLDFCCSSELLTWAVDLQDTYTVLVRTNCSKFTDFD